MVPLFATVTVAVRDSMVSMCIRHCSWSWCCSITVTTDVVHDDQDYDHDHDHDQDLVGKLLSL
jgi:hypothetical protein